MTRRRQLVEMRGAESNHLEHAGNLAARSIASMLKTLERQLAAIDHEIDDDMDPASRTIGLTLKTVANPRSGREVPFIC